LHQRKLIGEIADVWDGVALVVRISPFYRALGDFAALFAPTILFIIILLWFLNRRRERKAPTVPPAACILLILLCSTISCNKQETESTTPSQPRQSVVAPAEQGLASTCRSFVQIL